jgi:hypothetical protein
LPTSIFDQAMALPIIYMWFRPAVLILKIKSDGLWYRLVLIIMC